MTEKDFQQQVVDLARLYGWLVYHTFDSRRSEPGFPDLVLVRDTELIFAELKTEKGRLSAAQTAWLNALAKLAAATERAIAAAYELRRAFRGPRVQVSVWRPSDFEQIHDRLRRRYPETTPA